MRALIASWLGGRSDSVVPPAGFTARLTLLSAAAMAFLAVFALALLLATGRLADQWSAELARTATLRIAAPADQMAVQARAALAVLGTTPGIASARQLTPAEQQVLLEPWFGPDLPLDALPIPVLIEIVEDENGFDADNLRLRLQAEAPGAILDDHTRWRLPLIEAAHRLRVLGLVAIGLIAAATAMMITLAAQSALAANAQVIRVLRLVGADDRFVARAFVRRFTARGFLGGLAGTALGMIAILLLPGASVEGGFLTGLGFQGLDWFWPLVVPVLAAIVAFTATRAAALHTLRRLS